MDLSGDGQPKSGEGRWRGGRGGALEHQEAVVDRFQGLEEDGAHREWLSTTEQLGGGGMEEEAWTAGHRRRLGGRRGA
jgi:hypothetical protein